MKGGRLRCSEGAEDHRTADIAFAVSKGHIGPDQLQQPPPPPGLFLSQKYFGLRFSAVRSPNGAPKPSGSKAVSHECAYAVAFSCGTAPKYQGEESEANSRTPASSAMGPDRPMTPPDTPPPAILPAPEDLR